MNPLEGFKKWDFEEYTKHMLEKGVTVDEIPEERGFLDGKSLFADSISLTSFPRAGNTMIRAYLDKITGIYTGSAIFFDNPMNKALKEGGLAGEAVNDKRVWIAKNHYPVSLGDTIFNSQKAILIVRNPLDVIPSQWNVSCTSTHSLSVHADTYTDYSNLWDSYIKTSAIRCQKYVDFWLNSGIPVHVIRYEDCLLKPEETLTDLMKFIYSQKSLEGTRLEQHIKLACKKPAPTVYKPRVGKINYN